MRIKLFNESIAKTPTVLGGVRAIMVEDNHGNPIFIANHLNEDNIWCTKPQDKDFELHVKKFVKDRPLKIERR